MCQVYSAPDLKTVFAKRIHRVKVITLSWHPEEARIVSGGEDRSVIVWDARNGDVFLKFEMQYPIAHVRWSPDGQRIAAMDIAGHIQVWDARRGAQLSTTDTLAEKIHGRLKREMLSFLDTADFRSAFDQGKDMLRVGELRKKLSWQDFHLVALLAVLQNDREGYATYARRMLDVYSNSEDVVGTYFAVWTAVLLPGALEDYELAIRLARRVLKSDPDDRQLRLCLAVALLRAGRTKEASSELKSAREAVDKRKGSPAYLPYFLAIFESRMGNHEVARRHLQTANDLSEKELALRPPWNRGTMLRLLRREVETATGRQDSK